MSVSEIALAVQTAKGSPAASATQRSYLSGGTLVVPSKEIRLGGDTGTTRAPTALASYVTSVVSFGEPEIIVRPRMIGLLLYATLGAKAVSGASDPWTHTITLGTSVPYLTAWRHQAGLFNDRHADVRITRLVIAGRHGEPLRCQFSLAGGSPVYRSAQETGATVETADVMMYYHGDGALLVEGSTVGSLDEFTLVIEPGVALVEGLNGPRPVMTGRAQITVETSQTLASASLWNRMVYGTASPTNLAAPTLTPLELGGSPAGLRFTFTEQASPERSLQLALPRVTAQSIAPDLNARWSRDVLKVRYTAIAPAAGSAITAVLKNNMSAY